MNTLLAHPIPTLMHALGQNPFWLRSALTAVFMSPTKPLSRDPMLPAWHNYSSQSFGASSILLFKAAGCWHAKNRYASKIAPCLVCASSRTVLFPDALATSGVGFVQPSSRSPRSPHLKSYSRQRRPTRLSSSPVTKANSQKPANACTKIKKYCLPFTISRPNIGRIYGRLTQSNRPLRQSGCEPIEPRVAVHGSRP